MNDWRDPATGSIKYLQHILQLFGLKRQDIDNGLDVLVNPNNLDEDALARVVGGGLLLAIQPTQSFCGSLGITKIESPKFGTTGFNELFSGADGVSYRTLHPFFCFEGQGVGLVMDAEERAVWFFSSQGAGGILLIGTELIADLVRYRQGDPEKAKNRPHETIWDIAGERPVYLFQNQIADIPKYQERQADFWAMMLTRYVAEKISAQLLPILPGGAPGAIVITGDDDQAYLEKYAEQLELLGDTPITYFLHPLTRHTPQTLRKMLGKPSVDLGIHPDALESPHQYARLLKNQCSWFQSLVGKRASSVRNHGYLNDGYWGHLEPWLEEGISFSTNIPGLDGCALNGSLLPAKVFKDNILSKHWSVVTAIGDGFRYVNGGRSEEEAAQCILNLAAAIRRSGIPGVIVLNLHPQNIGDTRSMHIAALEVIRSGFVAWSMRDCHLWFENMTSDTEEPSMRPASARWWTRLAKLFRHQGVGQVTGADGGK